MIHETVDNKVIIVDDISFLMVNVKTMSQDKCLRLRVDWISRKMLFELCPHTKQRTVAFYTPAQN